MHGAVRQSIAELNYLFLGKVSAHYVEFFQRGQVFQRIYRIYSVIGKIQFFNCT